MEGGRLSRPRHCSKGAQPVSKPVHRSSCRDKHNRPRCDSNPGPLTLTVVRRANHSGVGYVFIYKAKFDVYTWLAEPRHVVVFTARCYASAVLAMGLCLSVCVCVCLTSRSSTKTAKRRITQTTPHDSPGNLVFRCQRSPRNLTGVIPYGAPNAGGVGQNRRLSTNNRLYLENGTR